MRGPELFVGYLDARLNDEAFDDEGWFRTGDLAVRDPDGYVQITGRRKDIIIRGGENISSVEVEDALAGAPGVAEAAVIAVPDEVMGEKVGAVVAAGCELDVDAVIAHVSTLIADFKVPQYLTVWDGPLPRNPGGKILKEHLRQQVEWGEPLR